MCTDGPCVFVGLQAAELKGFQHSAIGHTAATQTTDQNLHRARSEMYGVQFSVCGVCVQVRSCHSKQGYGM